MLTIARMCGYNALLTIRGHGLKNSEKSKEWLFPSSL